MTQVIGLGLSAVQSIVAVRPTAPRIDVDARKALQVRWHYQAQVLERAIMSDNQIAQDHAMAALLAIETEAMRNGVLEDLDTGDTDPASAQGRSTKMTALTAKAAMGHRAEIMGGYYRLNPLIWIPKSQQRGDGSELKDELYPVEHRAEVSTVPKYKPVKREKVKVDIMALGVRKQEPATTEGLVISSPKGQGPRIDHVAPISQVGKTAGQPLSQAQPLMVSKAEQLKAMKKAQAGQAKADGAGVGVKAKTPGQATTKKPKVVTLCLDGCGQSCGGRFAIGHDAKLKSVLTKIERGQLDISSVPEIARPFVKFSKPVIVPSEADPKIKTTTYQLLMAPVRFPGRDDIEYVQDLGEAFGHK